MSNPWDYFRDRHEKQQSVADSRQSASPFQGYVNHSQENKPTILKGEVEQSRVADPVIAPQEQSKYLPLAGSYRALPTQRGELQQTQLPAGIEEFAEKRGYNMNAYLDKYPQTPIIAGFKKQFASYTTVNISSDSDTNTMAQMVEQSGLFGRMNLPKKHITVLHQFDLAVPANLKDGVKCVFGYSRIKDRYYDDPEIDRTTTEGEVYTDYTLDGRPHRFFIGTVTFSHLDNPMLRKRAMIIPLQRWYPNRAAEKQGFRNHFSSDDVPGDDEGARLPRLETLPPHLQKIIKTYPGLLFGR